MCVCVCVMEFRRGLDCLELKLQVAVSCLMWVLETELGSSARAASALDSWPCTSLPVCPWVLNISNWLNSNMAWGKGKRDFQKWLGYCDFSIIHKARETKEQASSSQYLQNSRTESSVDFNITTRNAHFLPWSFYWNHGKLFPTQASRCALSLGEPQGQLLEFSCVKCLKAFHLSRFVTQSASHKYFKLFCM